MAKSKRKEVDYAGTFDRLMAEHFGEEFKTEWSIFAGALGGYVTARVNGKKLTKNMARVGRTISDAIASSQDPQS